MYRRKRSLQGEKKNKDKKKRKEKGDGTGEKEDTVSPRFVSGAAHMRKMWGLCGQ